MKKARILDFREGFQKALLSLKQLVSKAVSTKYGIIGCSAVLVLLLVIILLIPGPGAEAADLTLEATTEATEPAATAPAVTEPQPVGIPATMGTVISEALSICREAGADTEVDDFYIQGDRIEIQETTDVSGVLWGYTGRGWIPMDHIRMDDVPPTQEDPTGTVSNGSYAVLGYGVVDLKSLNVRSGPGTEYAKVKEIPQGIRYAYYEVSGDWVRIHDGWVSTEYFYVEGTAAEDATPGTVTTNDLNIRTGPDTTYQSVGSYMEGDSVQILAEVNGWGCTEKGWISMMYVELPEPVYTTGTATVTIGLNIRQEPDPNSEKVDVYTEGDRITVLEVRDGWGKTDKGWINLKYVKYD